MEQTTNKSVEKSLTDEILEQTLSELGSHRIFTDKILKHLKALAINHELSNSASVIEVLKVTDED